MWENVTAGPNNIWGLVQKNNGEVFIQEANDKGYQQQNIGTAPTTRPDLKKSSVPTLRSITLTCLLLWAAPVFLVWL